MTTPFDLYKKFIDDLVRIIPSVNARWVREHRDWPKTPKNERINAALSDLTEEQREVLAELLQHARNGGIHDTLAYLDGQTNLENLRMSWAGVELPVEPLALELHEMWVARRGGSPWPDAPPGA